MRAPYTQLFVHLIWSTWDRLPLISDNFRRSLYPHAVSSTFPVL